MMLNKLIHLANFLDDRGLKGEADLLYRIVRKASKDNPDNMEWKKWIRHVVTMLSLEIPKGIFKQEGLGSKRVTYLLNEDPDKVVKIQYKPGEENEIEFNNGIKYPDLFPTSYEHGSSIGFDSPFRWIVVERATPLKMAGLSFKDFFKEAHKYWEELGPKETLSNEEGRAIVLDSISIGGIPHTFDFFIQEIFEYPNSKGTGITSITDEIFSAILEREPIIKRILDISEDAQITTGDLDLMNMGIGGDSRLVILDVG
jgi:hypothetical protein